MFCSSQQIGVTDLTHPTMIRNGLIVSVDERETIYEDGAIVIEDERILDIGDSDRIVKQYRCDETLDARGKAILPGFINLHLHSAVTRSTAEGLRLVPWLRQLIDPELTALTGKSPL